MLGPRTGLITVFYSGCLALSPSATHRNSLSPLCSPGLSLHARGNSPMAQKGMGTLLRGLLRG